MYGFQKRARRPFLRKIFGQPPKTSKTPQSGAPCAFAPANKEKNMPSISLFNRRSPLSGYELQPLCTVVIIARLFQILLLIPMLTYILHAMTQNDVLDWWLFPPTNKENCRNSNLFPLLFSIYTFSTFMVTLFSIGLEIRIMKESSVGTPTQQELRPNIPHLLEMKLLPLSIVQSIVWIVGLTAVSYSVHYYSCLPEYRDVSAPELLPALSWYVPSFFLLFSQGIVFLLTYGNDMQLPNVSGYSIHRL